MWQKSQQKSNKISQNLQYQTPLYYTSYTTTFKFYLKPTDFKDETVYLNTIEAKWTGKQLKEHQEHYYADYAK